METITKIAENNVEVSEIKETRESQSYGQNRIDEELRNLFLEEQRINAFDKIKELEEINKKRNRLNLIQTEMNK